MSASTTSAAKISANQEASRRAEQLTCVKSYRNVAKSQTSTRNNCGSGCTGSTVTYTIKAGEIVSCYSQTDADNKAIIMAAAGAQEYANTNGTCNCCTDTSSGTVSYRVNSFQGSGMSSGSGEVNISVSFNRSSDSSGTVYEAVLVNDDPLLTVKFGTSENMVNIGDYASKNQPILKTVSFTFTAKPGFKYDMMSWPIRLSLTRKSGDACTLVQNHRSTGCSNC